MLYVAYKTLPESLELCRNNLTSNATMQCDGRDSGGSNLEDGDLLALHPEACPWLGQRPPSDRWLPQGMAMQQFP